MTAPSPDTAQKAHRYLTGGAVAIDTAEWTSGVIVALVQGSRERPYTGGEAPATPPAACLPAPQQRPLPTAIRAPESVDPLGGPLMATVTSGQGPLLPPAALGGRRRGRHGAGVGAVTRYRPMIRTHHLAEIFSGGVQGDGSYHDRLDRPDSDGGRAPSAPRHPLRTVAGWLWDVLLPFVSFAALVFAVIAGRR